MSFGESLTKIRQSKGISRKEFAEQLGIPYTTLRNYETGQREPGHKLLIKMALLLSVSVDNLIGRKLEPTMQKDGQATLQEMENLVKKYRLLDPYGKEAVDGVLDVESRRCEAIRAAALHKERKEMEISQELQDNVIYLRFSVPGYSMPMSAGTGQEAGQEYPENYQLVREPPRGTSYIATVSGNSMEPTYHDGDLLFIHACEEIAVGQVGVFYMDGKQWVKELGAEVLLSHNPDYPPRTITEDIRCQGLVLGVCDKSYFE